MARRSSWSAPEEAEVLKDDGCVVKDRNTCEDSVLDYLHNNQKISNQEEAKIRCGTGDRAGPWRVLLQACTRLHHQPPLELEIEQGLGIQQVRGGAGDRAGPRSGCPAHPLATPLQPARADDGETVDGDYDMVLAEQRDLARILPDDVVADVFRRLAPRWLAVSRCVCRDWRAAIDACRHLRADLLPLSFHGIFLHFMKHKFPEFFARPSSSTISGRLDFLPNTNTSIKVSDPDYYLDLCNYDILHHCNGLLLLHKYVVNPATRCWDPLPRIPRALFKPVVQMNADVHTTYMKYLVFDPTLSPHYEVFIIPQLYTRNFKDYFDPLVEKPSSPCIMRVFSSRSGQWELRSFVGEEGVEGTVSSFMLMGLPQFAVYWRGALYVQRGANFVVRISLSDNKYRVIRPPAGVGVSIHRTRYLDRSENGVYFAALDNYRLRVWILDESVGQMEWTLKQDKDLEPVLAPHRQVHGRWKLKDVNYNLYCSHLPKYINSNIVEEKLEWNSDSDDLDDIETEGYRSGDNKKRMKKQKLDSTDTDDCELYLEPLFYVPKIRILGFHPYREVVFLSESMEKGLAFHLTTSRVESLGNMYPTNYDHFKRSSTDEPTIKYSFSYTPCCFEEFPRNR